MKNGIPCQAPVFILRPACRINQAIRKYFSRIRYTPISMYVKRYVCLYCWNKNMQCAICINTHKQYTKPNIPPNIFKLYVVYGHILSHSHNDFNFFYCIIWVNQLCCIGLVTSFSISYLACIVGDQLVNWLTTWNQLRYSEIIKTINNTWTVNNISRTFTLIR